MRNFLRLSISFLLLVSCGNGNKVDVLSSSDKGTITPEITATVQAYVNEQYNYLTNGPVGKEKVSLFEDPASDEQKKILETFRSNLAKASLQYTAYTSEVRADSLSIAGDSVFAVVTDEVSLTTSDRDMEDTTKFIVTHGIEKYHVTLVRKEGKWLIRRFIPLEESYFNLTLQPGTEMVAFVRDTAKVVFAPPVYTYDAKKACTYASANWKKGNSAYCDFSGGGGDCTNFLSQCLLTGGWSKNADWTSKLKAECPACKNSSCEAKECYACSWTVAQDFKYYITHEKGGRITQVAKITDLIPGDILQYGTSTRIGHSTLVTKKSKAADGTIHLFVTYRNSSAGEPFENRFYMELGGDQFGWKVNASAQ